MQQAFQGLGIVALPVEGFILVVGDRPFQQAREVKARLPDDDGGGEVAPVVPDELGTCPDEPAGALVL
jgi:hypothetical protein